MYILTVVIADAEPSFFFDCLQDGTTISIVSNGTLLVSLFSTTVPNGRFHYSPPFCIVPPSIGMEQRVDLHPRSPGGITKLDMTLNLLRKQS